MPPASLRSMKKSFAQKERASSLSRTIKGKYLVGFLKKKSLRGWLQILKSVKGEGTMIFRINVFKLIQKYPGLKKSSVTLSFLKNYFKDIKRICQQNLSEFGIGKSHLFEKTSFLMLGLQFIVPQFIANVSRFLKLI